MFGRLVQLTYLLLCNELRFNDTDLNAQFHFYRAAWNSCRRGLAMRILSVFPSVKRVLCDKMVER